MARDDVNKDSLNSDNSSEDLSDDQVNAAFADLEKQFGDDFGSQLDDNLVDKYANDSSQSNNPLDPSDFSIDPHFDEELAGIIGDKAKIALLITEVRDARFLAALCKVLDIDALAVGFSSGACAILRDVSGQAPEEAAHDMSDLVFGMSVISCVNRADKISANLWVNGKTQEEITPPILFASLDGTVEDLMIGLQTVPDLDIAGYTTVESNSFTTTQEALKFIRSLMTNPGESDE
ncbi:hypothetical protein [Alloscardovia theropitheci]|nr:hypothetical protein [Alloscardovia theropitheci]